MCVYAGSVSSIQLGCFIFLNSSKQQHFGILNVSCCYSQVLNCCLCYFNYRIYVKLFPHIEAVFCVKLMKWRRKHLFPFLWSTWKDTISLFALLYIFTQKETLFILYLLLNAASQSGWELDQSFIVYCAGNGKVLCVSVKLLLEVSLSSEHYMFSSVNPPSISTILAYWLHIISTRCSLW